MTVKKKKKRSIPQRQRIDFGTGTQRSWGDRSRPQLGPDVPVYDRGGFENRPRLFDDYADDDTDDKWYR